METKRRERSDKGTRLTERDFLILRIIGEQYALRFDQLQLLLGQHAKAETNHTGILSASATRHAINRWKSAGLIEHKKILADLPAYCWLTTAGLHTASLPFRAFQPAASQLNHIYWTAQARLKFARENPDWVWQSERWQRAKLDQKIKSVKLPDALLQKPNNHFIAIEVELTQKNAVTLEQILRDRAMVYTQTWYFAATGTQQALRTALSQLEPYQQQHINVFPLDILK